MIKVKFSQCVHQQGRCGSTLLLHQQRSLIIVLQKAGRVFWKVIIRDFNGEEAEEADVLYGFRASIDYA